MQRPGEDVVPKDDVPWWMKYAGRGLGTVGGIGITYLLSWSEVKSLNYDTDIVSVPPIEIDVYNELRFVIKIPGCMF